MNIYYYIAQHNPDACLRFCHNYGYMNREINSIEELSAIMEQVVAAEGEEAFTELLKLHPDKGVIMETFSGRKLALGYDGSLDAMPMNYIAPHRKGCDCNNCYNKEKSFSADGSSNTKLLGTSSQTNAFIIAAALLLSVAIITRK